MENNEDILKEFEDFAAREETNPNFTLRFTQDQFGKETLFINLFGFRGQTKTQKQKKITLIVLLAFFILLTLFVVQNNAFIIAPLIITSYAIAFNALFVEAFFEINQETITKKKVLFGRYTVYKNQINCNELDRFEVVRKLFSTKRGIKTKYVLTAILKNENKREIYGSFKPALVNALDDVIEKFIGI